MFKGLFLTGSMLGMLGDFIHEKGVHIPEVDDAVAQYGTQARISLQLWSSLLQKISTAVNDPALGLAIGQRIAPRHVGVLGYLVLSCQTLGQALLRFARYQRLVYDVNPFSVHMDEQGMELRWGIDYGKPGSLVDETSIAALFNFLHILTNQPLHPSFVSFVNPKPKNCQVYSDYFHCPVEFEDTVTRVRFPAAYLEAPLLHSDPTLLELLSQQAESLLVVLPKADAFEEKLQQIMVQCLHEGEPTLPAVAAYMALSTRTLQRRLQERGLIFQDILEDTRRELAVRYLEDKSLSLTDIALLLGYSEQSAFNRAFKRWYQQPPKVYRKAL
ncbi:AraC family transcriptional regulator [Agitococcus lubricus]|uniref:AraC family transcriptional regulator n=1 Tax=Agitococcus lubricus TaxID=1077255 RepID=A0A2T5J3D2_9GAMM|nr:AraC family transcriptional regulator [Agitococcus lubricus]PTQ91124.1 AraC family transcriptional regulator [Agitococcus lubricus]